MIERCGDVSTPRATPRSRRLPNAGWTARRVRVGVVDREHREPERRPTATGRCSALSAGCDDSESIPRCSSSDGARVSHPPTAAATARRAHRTRTRRRDRVTPVRAHRADARRRPRAGAADARSRRSRAPDVERPSRYGSRSRSAPSTRFRAGFEIGSGSTHGRRPRRWAVLIARLRRRARLVRPAGERRGSVHLGVSGRLYRRYMPDALPMPRSLSPSSMSTFTSCPLAFRFSYIERLPEPPSAPASKGTLVHLALQHLMWRPPAERTIENALARPRPGRGRGRGRPRVRAARAHRRGVGQFHADAEVLAAALLRDRGSHARSRCSASSSGSPPRPPTASSSAASSTGSSSTPTASSSSPTTRPAASPAQGWEQQSLAGVHIYSLLCEQMFGRRPKRVQLLYLVEAGADHHLAERPVGARRRGEVGRGDEGGAHRVRARRLPAPRVGAVRVLLVPGVLPRVRRRSRRRPRR